MQLLREFKNVVFATHFPWTVQVGDHFHSHFQRRNNAWHALRARHLLKGLVTNREPLLCYHDPEDFLSPADRMDRWIELRLCGDSGDGVWRRRLKVAAKVGSCPRGGGSGRNSALVQHGVQLAITFSSSGRGESSAFTSEYIYRSPSHAPMSLRSLY